MINHKTTKHRTLTVFEDDTNDANLSQSQFLSSSYGLFDFSSFLWCWKRLSWDLCWAQSGLRWLRAGLGVACAPLCGRRVNFTEYTSLDPTSFLQIQFQIYSNMNHILPFDFCLRIDRLFAILLQNIRPELFIVQKYTIIWQVLWHVSRGPRCVTGIHVTRVTCNKTREILIQTRRHTDWAVDGNKFYWEKIIPEKAEVSLYNILMENSGQLFLRTHWRITQ